MIGIIIESYNWLIFEEYKRWESTTLWIYVNLTTNKLERSISIKNLISLSI